MEAELKLSQCWLLKHLNLRLLEWYRSFPVSVLKAGCSPTGTVNPRVGEILFPVAQAARKSGACIGGGVSTGS